MHGKTGSMTIITSAPLRSRKKCPEIQPCRAANLGVVQLSWHLLAQESENGRISSSFTDFMTTLKRSVPLCINPDVYHTQITEYSLETIFQCQNNFTNSRWTHSSFDLDILNSTYILLGFHPLLTIISISNFDWSCNEHISHALPTEMIIYLLSSIRFLQHPVRPYPSWTIELLEVIIKWLEVSELLSLTNPN